MQQSNACCSKVTDELFRLHPRINLKLSSLAKTTGFREQEFRCGGKQNFGCVKYSPQIPAKSIKDHPISYHSKGSLPLLKGPIALNPRFYPKSKQINSPAAELATVSQNVAEQKPLRAIIPSDKLVVKPCISIDPGFALPTEDSYKKITEFFNDVRGIVSDGSKSTRDNKSVSMSKMDTSKTQQNRIKLQKTLPTIKKLLEKCSSGTEPSTPKIIKPDTKNLTKKVILRMNPAVKREDGRSEGVKCRVVKELQLVPKIKSGEALQLNLAIPDISLFQRINATIN
eukprot:TRINITY_DN8153_c0_g2_i2.p1 TRINITY_DN8153_c0_g2~~TRINITY_DN8153_c0_g2_i2.p1  ORF type:complete len:284 (+),score=44.61 TRINITY_DN8153_c0_g2_i2:96-947(+)